MQNSKVIYSLRVYLALSQRGFNPIATYPNPNNQRLTCWVYERTPDFMAALDKIIGGAGHG